jgi:uncharacterized protein (TIGR02452 family)
MAAKLDRIDSTVTVTINPLVDKHHVGSPLTYVYTKPEHTGHARTSYTDMAVQDQADLKEFRPLPTSVLFHDAIDVKIPSTNVPITITLEQCKTGEAIEYHYKHGNPPLVALNFANAYKRGGGYLSGARAQEEDLCRKFPLLYASLSQVDYPIGGNVVYTDAVPQLRDSNLIKLGGEHQVVASFVTAAAPDSRGLSDLNDIESTLNKSAGATLDKMFTAITSSSSIKPTIIIGAWGCGVFAPKGEWMVPYQTAMLTLIAGRVLRYRHLVQNVVFACPGYGLLHLFRQALNSIILRDQYTGIQLHDRHTAKAKCMYDERNEVFQKIATDDNKILDTTATVIPVTRELHCDTKHSNNIHLGTKGAQCVIKCELLLTGQAIDTYWANDHPLIVLNHANAKCAGGGYVHGARAQEESLCRQYRLLYASLEKAEHLYPITNKVLFTPNVRRTRDTHLKQVLGGDRVTASFITAAAPNHNKLQLPAANTDYVTYITNILNEVNVFDRMERILMAASNPVSIGHSESTSNLPTLIIGAWGCGAFAPKTKDALFNMTYKSVIIKQLATLSRTYGSKFHQIVFACPEQSLISIFKETADGLQ